MGSFKLWTCSLEWLDLFQLWIEVLLDYPQHQGLALFPPLYLWFYSGLRVSRWVIRSFMDESDKKVAINTYSEVFLLYHLDSNILAQLCDWSGSHVGRRQQRTIIKKQHLSLLEGKMLLVY